jgi:hypothetical protein
MANSAIETFKTTFGRAHSQINGATSLLELLNEIEDDRAERNNETKKQKQQELNDDHAVSDMARFGIVLAVAAMDDYFTRKYAEVFVPTLKRHGTNKHCVDMLGKAGLDLKSAIELLTMERPFSRIRKLAQEYYKNYSTQNTNRIDELFKTIGISGLSVHAQNRSTKKKTLITSIDKIVSRRHTIVHAGDISRSGKLNPMKIEETKRRLNDVAMFVQCSDLHIEAFKTQKIKKS